MPTLRVRSVPESVTPVELCRIFSDATDRISLARTETGKTSMTLTVTFEHVKAAKQYFKGPVSIRGEEVLIDNDFLGLTILSSHNDDDVEYYAGMPNYSAIRYQNSIIAVHGLNLHTRFSPKYYSNKQCFLSLEWYWMIERLGTVVFKTCSDMVCRAVFHITGNFCCIYVVFGSLSSLGIKI